MSELKLVTRNIRINGIQHKASDMSEEEIKCLLIQRQDIILLKRRLDTVCWIKNTGGGNVGDL